MTRSHATRSKPNKPDIEHGLSKIGWKTRDLQRIQKYKEYEDYIELQKGETLKLKAQQVTEC